MGIRENVKALLQELPPGVLLVAAAKTRGAAEIREAIDSGVSIVGENYVQEAERARAAAGSRVQWHFIGHLQKNKVKKAVSLFDMIETVDSAGIAREIDRRCAETGKVMPVLIEINSGREEQKTGVSPEGAEALAREVARLPHLKLMGLMTMGPRTGDPQDARRYFKETRTVFEQLKRLSLPGTEMRYLSMGMTNSYRVALEEGANMVRLGSKLFGERPARDVARGGDMG